MIDNNNIFRLLRTPTGEKRLEQKRQALAVVTIYIF